MSPLVISIITGVAIAWAYDAAGYIRAKQKWRNDPISFPKPTFDFPLFFVRTALGVALGFLDFHGVPHGITQGLNP